jgi:uncharacterized OsmC-like protein
LRENSKLIERIREDPKRAQYNQKVNVKWDKKYVSNVSIRRHKLKIDEPRSVNGDDSGPSPTELLLAAIAGCELSMISRQAFLKKISIEEMSINITGMIDIQGFMRIADVPSGFQEITINLTIKSSETKKIVEDLVDEVLDHCPVLETIGVSPTLKVNHKLNFI